MDRISSNGYIRQKCIRNFKGKSSKCNVGNLKACRARPSKIYEWS